MTPISGSDSLWLRVPTRILVVTRTRRSFYVVITSFTDNTLPLLLLIDSSARLAELVIDQQSKASCLSRHPSRVKVDDFP